MSFQSRLGGRYARLAAAEKHEIIRLVEGSELSARRTLRELSIHRSTCYGWYRRYRADGGDGLAPRPAAARQHWNRRPSRVRQRVVDDDSRFILSCCSGPRCRLAMSR